MKLPITFNLKPGLFALLALGFILTTIVGTLTHEAAHFYVAKHYGFQPKLHYASVSYGDIAPYALREFDSVYEANKDKILAKQSSPEKEAFLKYRASVGKKLEKQYFNITITGPLQTIIAGTLGLLLLWIRKSKIKIRGYLNFADWIFVMLAFFWSRQLANCMLGIYYFINGRDSSRSDEGNIAEYLDISHWAIDISGAVIASLAILWVVFRVILKQYRFTFLVAGLTGSIAGWMVWMETYGPAILP